jgi:hypothetical protein
MPTINEKHPYLNFHEDNFARIPLCGNFSNKHCRDKLRDILKFYNNNTVYYPPHIKNYVDHGIVHAQNVWVIANRLIYDNKKILNSLTDFEKFSFCCAIWLHDIGMSKNLAYLEDSASEKKRFKSYLRKYLETEKIDAIINAITMSSVDVEIVRDFETLRKYHSLISDYFIRNPAPIIRLVAGIEEPLTSPFAPIDNELKKIIGTICRYHQFWDLEKCSLNERYRDEYIRTRYLSALLRIVDDLDQLTNRCSTYYSGDSFTVLMHEITPRVQKLRAIKEQIGKETKIELILKEIDSDNVDEKLCDCIKTSIEDNSFPEDISNLFRDMLPFLESLIHHKNKMIKDVGIEGGIIKISIDSTACLSPKEQDYLKLYKRDRYQNLKDCCKHIVDLPCSICSSLQMVTPSSFEKLFEDGNFSFKDPFLDSVITEMARERIEEAWEKRHKLQSVAKDKSIIYQFVDRYSNSIYPLYRFNNLNLPVILFPAPEEQWNDVDSVLGQLLIEQTTEDYQDLAIEGKENLTLLQRFQDANKITLYGGEVYRMLNINLSNNQLKMECGVSEYFDMLKTCEALQFELFTQIANSDHISINDLPLRKTAEEIANNDPTKNGFGRCALVGVSVLTVFKMDTGWGTLIHERSKEVALDPKLLHVIPAATFESEYGDRPKEYSVKHLVYREYLEEIFNDEEVRNSDSGKISYNWFYNKPNLKYLRECLDNKNAELILTGIAINLFNLRPEILILLLIKTPEWFKSHEHGDPTKELSKIDLNWEFSKYTRDTPQHHLPIVIRLNDKLELDKDYEYLDERLSKPANWVPVGGVAFYHGLKIARKRLGI